jgi:hypothetical protein
VLVPKLPDAPPEPLAGFGGSAAPGSAPVPDEPRTTSLGPAAEQDMVPDANAATPNADAAMHADRINLRATTCSAIDE